MGKSWLPQKCFFSVRGARWNFSIFAERALCKKMFCFFGKIKICPILFFFSAVSAGFFHANLKKSVLLVGL